MKVVDDRCNSNLLSNHGCKFCSFLSARSGLCSLLDSENMEKVE